MKRIFGLVVLIVLWSVGSADAACVYQYKRVQDAYQLDGESTGLVYKCTVDSENTIADLSDAGVTGQFQVIDIEFTSGDTAPTSVTPVVKTWGVASATNSVTVFTGTATTNLATGRQKPDVPELITGGIKIAFTVVADAEDIFYVVLGML